MTLNDTKFDIKKTLDTLKDDITDWIVLAIAEKIQIKDWLIQERNNVFPFPVPQILHFGKLSFT